jgi:response regulator NasT
MATNPPVLVSYEREGAMRELRILVAEDKWLVAKGLKVQLEGLGHRVVGVARDAREAVRSTLRLEPELVITDIQLPIIDGIETARTVLAYRPVPIIVLAAYEAADLVRRAREAGVMACLVTPVDRLQLSRVIDEALVRFRELEVIRREASDMKEALETRALVERAKRVLMRRLTLSESEAFRRLQEQTHRIGTSFGKSASTIVRAEELLFKDSNVARSLPSMLAAIRRGLKSPPDAQRLHAAARSRLADAPLALPSR